MQRLSACLHFDWLCVAMTLLHGALIACIPTVNAEVHIPDHHM